MVSFTEIVEASWEWMATVLFRPFKAKKWLILIFVALMAGYISGGCNLNLGGYNSDKIEKRDSGQSANASTNPTVKEGLNSKLPATPEEIKHYIREQLKEPAVLTLAICAALLFLILFVLAIWLSARFDFIFLDNITKNKASVVEPFRAFREMGNSLFLFILFYSILFLVLLGLIIFYLIKSLLNLGIFTLTAKLVMGKIIITCIGYGLVILSWCLVGSILMYLIINDFVVPLMFKDKIKFRQAWLKFIELFNNQRKAFLIFWALRVGLSIGCNIAIGILSFLMIIALIIPIGIIIRVLIAPSYLLYKPAVLIILFLVCLPILLFISYCFLGMFLPFGIFLRTLSLKFLARLDNRYDFFKY